MLIKLLKLCWATILLSGMACTSVPKPSSSIASEVIADLIAEYRQEIAHRMRQENVPGLAIVVVDDQSILWAEGFGYTDWNRRTLVHTDTLFSIQSMSKSFTATAAMFAAQDGLVDLDEPITTYLPDFHVNSIFEEHPQQKMTLRMLLSHTAGFVHEAPIGGNSDLPGPSFEEHIASISETWLRFPVGTRWAYSNLGIDLAGYILQVRSGMPFTQYVQEKVLDPLVMTHSTLDIHQVRATADRAIGHDILPFRPPAEFLLIPSGGVWVSANDMARYLQFHINEGALGGQRLLRQDLAETMYAPPNPAALDAHYALGIGTVTWQGTRRFQHGGGGFGFNSNMVWYPELKLGAVVLSNAHDAGLNMQLVDDLLDDIISANIPLYHSRASLLPSVEPAYGFIQNEPALLTDRALRDLITSKALPLDEAGKQRRQTYTGDYVQTRWGIPLIQAQIEEVQGRLTLTALDQTAVLNEIQPGLLFDSQGTSYKFPLAVSTSPNYPIFKIDPQFLPLQLTFHALCGLVFLSTLLFNPIRGILRWIRKAETYGITSPRSHWLRWIGILSVLASLWSLVCLGFTVFIPNMIHVPWPRPYVDLLWWQFALLSLPFASLALGFVMIVLVWPGLRGQTDGRAVRFYYFSVAVALLAFNLVILI